MDKTFHDSNTSRYNTRNIKTEIEYEQPMIGNALFVLFVVTQATLRKIVRKTELLQKIKQEDL